MNLGLRSRSAFLMISIDQKVIDQITVQLFKVAYQARSLVLDRMQKP